MKIKVDDIQDGAQVAIAHDYRAALLDVDFPDLRFSEEIHLSGELSRDMELLKVRGILKTSNEQTCSRCLKVSISPVAQRVDLFYDTKDKEYIDLTDDIRELLMLEHQPKYLCRSDCRGLCSRCGTDLNENACTCYKQVELAFSDDIQHKMSEHKVRG